jgi:sugar phosphate isomerase/epimerase
MRDIREACVTIKTGYSTLCLQGHPFKDLKAYLSRCPNSVCEILNDGLHLLNRGRARLLKSIGSSYGLEYTMHLPFAHLNYAVANASLRRATQRIIIKALEHAFELECTCAVVHSGQTDPLSQVFFPDVARKYYLEFLEELGERGADYGIKMLIENNVAVSYFIHSIEEMERFLAENLSRGFSMALDIGHAFITNDLDDYVRRLPRAIHYIHLHDNLGKQDNHLALDKGSINWRGALEGLIANGFNGIIVVENLSWEDAAISLSLLGGFLERLNK